MVAKIKAAADYTGTLEFLKTIVTYDMDTGDMRTNFAYGNKPYLNPRTGYRMLRLPVNPEGLEVGKRNMKYYRTDCLAWFIATGTWPVGAMEHLNGFNHDDTLDNLVFRDVNQRRWWYGAQPGSSFRYLIEIESAKDVNEPLADVYHEGNRSLILPRPKDGWLNKAKERQIVSVDTAPDLERGEFGKDWR